MFFFVAALCTLFGVMHSPLPGSPLFLPWQLAEESQRFVYQFALGYALVAAMLLVWGLVGEQQQPELTAPGRRVDDARGVPGPGLVPAKGELEQLFDHLAAFDELQRLVLVGEVFVVRGSMPRMWQKVHEQIGHADRADR